MAKKSNIIVGLDIGSSKTCVIVGEQTGTSLDIIGIGSHPSEGLRKGVVVNIESTVEAIKRAVEEAEHMSGCEIASVYTGISGSHIAGRNSLGIVAVKGREVDEDDVQRAIEQAKAIPIPADKEILHTLPQSYTVDGQDGIIDPIGMSGVRLEAKVHIVVGGVTYIQNITKAVNRVGLDINAVILEPLAAGEAVLSADEKDLGVALVDIGGGTTNVGVFSEGSLKHTGVLLVDGTFITSDIAAGLRTPLAEAEKIKLKFGCAYTPLIPKDETIEVPSVGGREPRAVSRQILGRIVEPRLEEILTMASREIAKSGLEETLAAGVVLTGGTVLIDGVMELAEQVFNMPVRRGCPSGIGGLTDVVSSPVYATAVGLVMYASRNFFLRESPNNRGLIKRISEWLLKFF